MTAAISTDVDQWTIGNLVLNSFDAQGGQWIVNPQATSGWYDGPVPRLNLQDAPRSHGAYRAPSYNTERTIVVPGKYDGRSVAAAIAARDYLTGLYANGTQQLLTVAGNGISRSCMVELGAQPKLSPFVASNFDFQLTLTAADPVKYAPALSATTAPFTAATGLNWVAGNLVTNASFSGGSTGGWGGLHSATLTTGTDGILGTYCRVTSTQNSTATGILASSQVPVTGGASYSYSAFVRPQITSGVTLDIDWYNASGYMSTSFQSFPGLTGGTATTVSNSFTAPAGATGAILYVDNGTLPVGDYFDITTIVFFASAGSGLDWATGGGLNWGTVTSSGQCSLTNPGTADSWPVFTIAANGGSITNPALTDSLTGNVISFALTLTNNDSLVITSNPLARTVLLNGVDRMPAQTSLQWWVVPAGATDTVSLTQSAYTGAPTLTMSMAPAYW